MPDYSNFIRMMAEAAQEIELERQQAADRIAAEAAAQAIPEVEDVELEDMVGVVVVEVPPGVEQFQPFLVTPDLDIWICDARAPQSRWPSVAESMAEAGVESLTVVALESAMPGDIYSVLVSMLDGVWTTHANLKLTGGLIQYGQHKPLDADYEPVADYEPAPEPTSSPCPSAAAAESGRASEFAEAAELWETGGASESADGGEGWWESGGASADGFATMSAEQDSGGGLE